VATAEAVIAAAGQGAPTKGRAGARASAPHALPKRAKLPMSRYMAHKAKLSDA
jgi:hypothetical protein